MPAAWLTLPALWRLTAQAVTLSREPYEERRAILHSRAFHDSVRTVVRAVPEDEPVALILGPGKRDIDVAVFVNYELYPRPVKLYYGTSAYALDPEPPKRIVLIDDDRASRVKLVDFATARQELARDRFIARGAATSVEAREFIVPFVGSTQSLESYMTEAVLATRERGTVTLRVEPGGITRTFGIDRVVRLADVAPDVGTGWMRITSNVPLRAGVWFVNRTRPHAAPLPLLTAMPPLPQRLRGGETLWLLNTADVAANVRVNGAPRTLAPHALERAQAAADNVIDGDGSVFAFTSQKEKDGATTFFWPEHTP